ncbi:hypothetical protein F5Y15DRAFT_377472 [Xylariaceae sp. FL0016]|nr:hypothetical protein F5Y15DRAFT_377472 [Xylariaceae sp. FL0016]
MPPLQFLLLLIGVFASYVAAASPPTFCKCTCFKNSTLIQLGPQSSSGSGSSSGSSSSSSNSQHALRAVELDNLETPTLESRAASSSCTQCTRAFCLSHNLPICKDAEETDVLATCFQRDSRKDQIIVWGFILGTAGLLGWAAAKRVVEIRQGKKTAALGLAGPGGQDRGAYTPVDG